MLAEKDNISSTAVKSVSLEAAKYHYYCIFPKIILCLKEVQSDIEVSQRNIAEPF